MIYLISSGAKRLSWSSSTCTALLKAYIIQGESILSGLTHSQSSHLKMSCACFHMPDFPPELHPLSLGSHSSTAPCLARAARGPASIQESQQSWATVNLYPVVDSVTANTPRGSSAGTRPPALVT